MDNVLISVGYLIVCYMLGWFMTGYFVVRLFAEKDIRQEGSGNIGAMNSGRAAGAKGFVLTFLGDFCKGYLAMGLGVLFQFPDELLLLGLTAVVAGHIWPAPFCFRGGKGISTFAGGLAVFSPLGLLLLLLLAGVFYLLLREFTPAGLAALIFWPVIAFVQARDILNIERNIIFKCILKSKTITSNLESITSNQETIIFMINLVLTFIILYAHRQNIKDYAERHIKRR